MKMRAKKTVYYVTRRRFFAHFRECTGAMPITIERGCILEACLDELFTPSGSEGMGNYDPCLLGFPQNNLKVDTFKTFASKGGFHFHFWGPFDEKMLHNGIWYVRGTFGQDGESNVSVLAAGQLIKYDMDDLAKRRLIHSELFPALLGEQCLSISATGEFSLLSPLTPVEYLLKCE